MPIDLVADVPVGAVTAWAGQLADKAPPGWLACDGTAYSRTAQAELYAAIGTSNGAPSEEEFRVPDLRGMFLRGADDGAGRDPDLASRVAPAGSEAGTGVGSRQSWSTALPHIEFEATVAGLPGDSRHEAYGGVNVEVIRPVSSSTDCDVSGGDAESRPVNANLQFLIKAVSTVGQGDAVRMPPAAVLGYAGTDATMIDDAYVPCDGHAVRDEGIYATVFDATGSIFGGTDTEFCLPRLTGAFLRGVSGSSGEDPDAETRGVPRPDLPAGQQGLGGNNCGSAQTDATGNPAESPLQASFGLPSGSFTSTKFAGKKSVEWNPGSLNVSVATGGGDAETRPVSVSVSWYLRTGGRTNPTVPLGMVLAAAGPVPREAPGRWLPCDGRLLPIDGFRDLYNVLGDRYGSTATQFALPDYRGRFLRGAADLASTGTEESWSTRLPRTPFTATLNHLPKDYWQTSHTVGSQGKTVGWQSSRTVTPFGGGGAETRPRNVAVEFVIKVQHAAPDPS